MPKPYQPTSWLPGGRTIAKGPNALELQNESYERRQKLATTKAATTAGLAEVGHSIEIIQAAAPKIPEDLYASTLTAQGNIFGGKKAAIVIPYNNCAYWPLKMGGSSLSFRYAILPIIAEGTTATRLSMTIYAVDTFKDENDKDVQGLVWKGGTTRDIVLDADNLMKFAYNFTLQEGVEYFVGVCGVNGKITLSGVEGLNPNTDEYMPRRVHSSTWDNDGGSGTNSITLELTNVAGEPDGPSKNSNMHVLFQVNHDTGGSERLTAVTQGDVTWTLLFRKWDSNDMITSCWYSTDVADKDVTSYLDGINIQTFPMSDITLTFSTSTIPQGCAVVFDVPNVTAIADATRRTSTSSPGWNDTNGVEAVSTTYTAYLNWIVESQNDDNLRYIDGKVFAELSSEGTVGTAPRMMLSMDTRNGGGEYSFNIYGDTGAGVKTSYGTIRFSPAVFGAAPFFMMTSKSIGYQAVDPDSGADLPRSCPTTVAFNNKSRDLWANPSFGIAEILFTKTSSANYI